MRTGIGSVLLLLGCSALAPGQAEKPGEIILGNVRLQALSPTLLRIETREGQNDFVNEPTHWVVERHWPGARLVKEAQGRIRFAERYVIHLEPALRVTSLDGKLLWEAKTGASIRPFPGPTNLAPVLALVEGKQLIPPPWGATPPSPEELASLPAGLRETGGWRAAGASTYLVFTDKGYVATRQEYLRLTGPIPMLPIWAYGFQACRYHKYDEARALKAIDTFRTLGIPLDVFVIDTDWRIDGSKHGIGYDVDPQYFPNMQRFLAEAHKRNVKVGFNDHPVNWYPKHLRPDGVPDKAPSFRASIEFSAKGLTGLMNQGLDWWWWDQNWNNSYYPPLKEFDGRSWCHRLFWDIQQRQHPDRRPFLWCMLGNTMHRYPAWWTGDNGRDSLAHDARTFVDRGVSLQPYVTADFGGHHGLHGPGNPGKLEHYDLDRFPTLFKGDWSRPAGFSRNMVRWFQMGVFSPLVRAHGNTDSIRYPWAYGPEAQQLLTDLIKLRYRLMPTIYTAARRTHDDGTPIMRRLDLEWPDYPEARDSSQYLFGDDLLVMPFLQEITVVPPALLRTPDGQPGVKAEFFAVGPEFSDNPTFPAEPTKVATVPAIDFDWGSSTDYFAVRLTGTLGPIRDTGLHSLGVRGKGGMRMWLDGQLIGDSGKLANGTQPVQLSLEAGKSYRIKVEFWKHRGRGDRAASLQLCYLPWLETDRRTGWIPPGEWEDLWTGELIQGPKTIEVTAPQGKVPLFARRGGMVLLAPDMQWTQEKPWDPITIELYPGKAGVLRRSLYEDDGTSLGYRQQEWARTDLVCRRPAEKRIELQIAPALGTFRGQREQRSWIVRCHLLPGEQLDSLRVDGTAATPTLLPPRKPEKDHTLPLQGWADAPPSQAGAVVEVRLPPGRIREKREVVLTLR